MILKTVEEFQVAEVELDSEAGVVDGGLECSRQFLHLLLRLDERDSPAFDVHVLLQFLRYVASISNEDAVHVTRYLLEQMTII